ncbi:MAG: hypothetical protein LBJ64_00365, partial [Deltaproteobacteria bacterium]|nr:hypothetical protein [Deltaproteobacteria bacterium]
FASPDRFTNSANLSRKFDMQQILGTITALEGYKGNFYYIANVNSGGLGAETVGGASRQPVASSDTNLCMPRVLNNLADVRGMCPSAPQTYGTYAVAAAAYYGNTHDFDGSGNRVQTFVVALPTIFPKINLESKGKVISITPVAMSVKYPCGQNKYDSRFCQNDTTKPQGIQFLGPMTTSVIQWRADDQGRVYSGAIFAGFNGRLEGEGEDYQLDAPVRYYFDLIRECNVGECDGDRPYALKESFRYQSHENHSNHPNYSEEREATWVFFSQKKYVNTFNYPVTSSASCTTANRDKVAGCGGASEREIAKKIILDFDDGRYAAAPFKRYREWVYKNWDHAGRPNYIFSIERPKNYAKLAYMPKRWSQLPATILRPVSELDIYWYPDPSLIQAYARARYPDMCGSGKKLNVTGCNDRRDKVRILPGGMIPHDNKTGSAKGFNDDMSVTDANKIDLIDGPDRSVEAKSMFIDRPFAEIGYEEVMDVYGYIGEPGHIYKKVNRPEDIDKAVGVAIFVYSLNEIIDKSNRSLPINIGYYMHGGLNYAQTPIENKGRTLGNAEGTYIEIQNEHNYMGGDPQEYQNQGNSVSYTTVEQFQLMTIAHPFNTPPTCFRANQARIREPMNFRAAEDEPLLFKRNNPGRAVMPGFTSDTNATTRKSVTPDCGSARLPLTSTRLFRFPTDYVISPPNYLPDPLWLTAKYGGFVDQNNNGIPEKNEYDILPAPNGDGIPDNYYYASNLSELKDKLSEAFERIMSTVKVGTATSSAVNSVLGGGVTVRTYFQTVHTPNNNSAQEINWIGGAYALFVDLWGNMREDTNRNGRLDLNCGFADETGGRRGDDAKGDWIVEFVDCNRLRNSQETVACGKVRDAADLKTVVRVFPDQTGRNNFNRNQGSFISLQDVRTIWNLSRNLSSIANKNDVVTPRAYKDLSSNRRRVYFHQDGVTPNLSRPVKLGENNLFTTSKSNELSTYLMKTPADSVKLIEYVLGWDQAGY